MPIFMSGLFVEYNKEWKKQNVIRVRIEVLIIFWDENV